MSPTRWGGAAACLAGGSYGAWGYFDRPDAPALIIDAVLPVLGLITPLFFFGGLVGLYFRLEKGSVRLGRTGLLLGLLGTALGLIAGVDRWSSLPYSGAWLPLLLTGLTMMGVSTLVAHAPQVLRALVITSGTLGWVSVLTDPAFSGALVPMRSLHVAFAALFCISTVVWGWVLFRETL